MPLPASAIVCTLDRGPAIVGTIDSLLRQDADPRTFEILIVDNRSNPANAALLRGLATAHPDRVRYVREENLGESAARNCALREARGDVLAFLDDDAEAAPQWLRTLLEAFAGDPHLGALGGRITLRYEVEPPTWLDASLLPYLSAFDRGDRPALLAYPEYPRGANMAFRLQVFADAGEFSERFGRKGDCLLSYSEIEMCWRIERAGWRIGYVPAASIEHIVPPGRLQPGWFERRIHWQGRSLALFDRVHHGPARVLSRMPMHAAKWLRRSRPQSCYHAGYLAGAMRALLQ